MRCSAYKVPTSALMAYWKNLYGSNIDISGCMTFRTHEKIEVVLLDGDGEEIRGKNHGAQNSDGGHAVGLMISFHKNAPP